MMLDNCPFYGGPSQIYRKTEGRYYNRTRYYPSCQDEHCIGRNLGKSYATEEEAVAAWNERAPMLPCKIGDIMFGVRCFRGVYKTQSSRVSEMYYVPGKSREEPMKLHILLKYVCRGEFGKDVFDDPHECDAECERRNRDAKARLW